MAKYALTACDTMKLLFPNLPLKPWKAVNLDQEFKDYNQSHEPVLNCQKVEDQITLLNYLAKDECYTYGGFGEDRSCIFESEAEKMIHLGVDFNNLPVGQDVTCLSGGKVIDAWVDESKFHGWGGRIIIHDENQDICYLYGHLKVPLQVEKGQMMKPLDILGQIGDSSTNGGWYPHLHLQIMKMAYLARFEDLRKLDGYASNQEQTDIYNPIAYLNTFVDITIYGHGDRQKLLDSVYKTVLDSPSAISKIVFKCDYIGCDKERDNFEDLVQFKCTNTNCNLELDFCRTHSENFQCFRCESMCELFATNPEISNHDFQIKD